MINRFFLLGGLALLNPSAQVSNPLPEPIQFSEVTFQMVYFITQT
jgi:hypothetical protein